MTKGLGLNYETTTPGGGGTPPTVTPYASPDIASGVSDFLLKNIVTCPPNFNSAQKPNCNPNNVAVDFAVEFRPRRWGPVVSALERSAQAPNKDSIYTNIITEINTALATSVNNDVDASGNRWWGAAGAFSIDPVTVQTGTSPVTDLIKCVPSGGNNCPLRRRERLLGGFVGTTIVNHSSNDEHEDDPSTFEGDDYTDRPFDMKKPIGPGPYSPYAASSSTTSAMNALHFPAAAARHRQLSSHTGGAPAASTKRYDFVLEVQVEAKAFAPNTMLTQEAITSDNSLKVRLYGLLLMYYTL